MQHSELKSRMRNLITSLLENEHSSSNSGIRHGTLQISRAPILIFNWEIGLPEEIGFYFFNQVLAKL